MRLIFSCIGISTALMLANGTSFSASSHPKNTGIGGKPIYGLSNANHFVAIGALGIANLNTGNGFLGVTSSETDQLVQTNGKDWNVFNGQLGGGYVYYLHDAQSYSEYTQWFPLVEPEINGYYLSRSNIQGDVLRFSNPAFNDMTYTMPVDSFRLMFDTALTLVSKRQYSLYAIGGIGNSWNRVGYRDADNNGLPCSLQPFYLNTTTRGSFAWEVGAGLSYAINYRFALSLEYLYADLGRIKTPANGFMGDITTPVIVPASFKLASQAALVGLHVAI